MKAIIYTNLVTSSVPPEVTIEHNGESIKFSVSVFTRRAFQEDYDVFEEINNYWASIPNYEQDQIFSIYKEVFRIFTDTLSTEGLSEAISKKVTELYNLHNFDKLTDYVAFKSNIRVPTNIANDYVGNIDINKTRDKTYIAKDYKALMTLSLMLRPLIPVWGEYIANSRREIGNQFKEFFAFNLLKHTDILELEATKKLVRYIENILGNSFRPDVVLSAISSDDFTDWVLKTTCVKKLAICDLRGVSEDYNAISYLHRFIRQKAENKDNNYENLYKEKKFDDGSGEDVNKLSLLESYKIKSDLSPGEIVELEFSISDLYQVARSLNIYITSDMVDKCLKSSARLAKEPMVELKLSLLAYVFKDVISPRALMYLPKHTIANLLCILEEVLWQRGHKYLAILATSYPDLNNSDMVISPVDSRIKISPELSERLTTLYPYTRSIIPKRKNYSEADIKSNNLVAESINGLTDKLSMYSWILTANQKRVKEVFGSSTRKCPIIPDIKNSIATLLIELGERSYL